MDAMLFNTGAILFFLLYHLFILHKALLCEKQYVTCDVKSDLVCKEAQLQ